MISVKVALKKIYSAKYYILLFIVAFVLFFRFLFPDEKVAQGIFDNIKAQTGIIIEASDPSFSFVPTFGVNFSSAQLRFSPNGEPLTLGKTQIGISPLSVLMFSPALKLESESFRGTVQIKVSGFSMTGAPVDELYVKLYAVDIQLRDIMKTQLSADIFATTDINAEGYLNLRNVMYSDLSIEAILKDVKSTTGTSIGFFALPPFSIKKGELSAQLQKSELTVGRFILGGPGDDLDGSFRGKWSSRSGQYEFTVKLKFAGGLEKTVGAFSTFLPPAAKKPDGSYSFRLNGDPRLPIPNITPL